MAQKPRTAPRNVADSLPRRNEGTDVAPDDLRRTDQPRVPPDSLPPEDERETTADGGVGQHPIHDSDQEDRDPEDFEREVDREGQVAVDTVVRRQG